MEQFTKQQREKLTLLSVILMLVFAAGLILSPVNRFYSETTGILRIGVFSNSIWGESNGYAHVILNEAIKAFEAKYPGTSVVYESGIRRQDYSEWLSTEILKGTAPDVFFVLDEDFEYLTDVGALQDLSEFAAKDRSFAEGVYYPTAYDAGKRRSIQYALPYECSPEIMVVNLSILENENIELPAREWTWEDCFDICKKVTGPRDNESGYQFGISKYDWESCFCSNDVNLFSEDGEKCYLTDETAGEAIRFLDRLGALTAKKTNVQPSFSDGNVLFQPMSYSAYNAYISNPIHMGIEGDFMWKIHTMPAGPSGDNNSLLKTQLIAMNSQSTRKQMAWELMKTLTSDPEIQKEIARYSEGISVLRNVPGSGDGDISGRNDSEEREEVISFAMEHSKSRQRFKHKEEAFQQIDIAVNEILSGSGNIKMEQIIHNRRINNYIEQLNISH